MAKSKTIFDMGRSLHIHKIKSLRWDDGGIGASLLKIYSESLKNIVNITTPLTKQLSTGTQFTPSGKGAYFYQTPTIKFKGATVFSTPKAPSVTIFGMSTRRTFPILRSKRGIRKMKQSKIHPRWTIAFDEEDRPEYLLHIACPQATLTYEGRTTPKRDWAYSFIGDELGARLLNGKIHRSHHEVTECLHCGAKAPKIVKFFINMIRINKKMNAGI
jgi:hypothetical protein